VAIFSETDSHTKENYKICDPELGEIVKHLEQWGTKCKGSAHPINTLTDHQNWEYFMTSKLLNWTQTRLSQSLSCCKIKIVYHPSNQEQKPDTPTSILGDISPKGGADKIQQIVLKTEILD
jgi:hypothetical protein